MITDEQRAEMLAATMPTIASARTVGSSETVCAVYSDGAQRWFIRGDNSTPDLQLTAWLDAGNTLDPQ